MSVRSVIVRLEAEVARYVAGMGQAASATDTVAQRVTATRQSVNDNSQAMEKLGGSFLKVGAIGVAALGATAKAALDWESAWAGVTKTVDGTPAQMDALESSLRGLAKTLPATHQDIAAVAEAAGQLGVAREDVVGFTKTMIDLGETTNLTSDEAATSIAQISNVMGTMANGGSKDVERFGATLVALGNAGASTEKEILGMAQRLSGAMKLVGGSEADLLAMANAMASVGIEAQLGGGVMSRVMQRMYADVMDGGEGLTKLAEVAGVSSQDFATAFETDPVRAVDTLIKGLSRVKDEGGNVIQTMADLGIKGTEETSVILRLAGAGDLLSDSLTLGATAWQENSALAEEAAKRYETTQAKISIAWNNIKDAAISAGAVILPVVAGLMETITGLAQGFGELPQPAQSALTIIAGLATAAVLVGGGLLTLIPKIAEMRQALQDLSASGSAVPGVMGKIGKAVGIVGAAIAVLGAAVKIADSVWGEEATSAEEYSQALLKVGTSATSLNGMFEGIYSDVQGVGDAFNKLGEGNWSNNLAVAIDDALGTSMQGITQIRDHIQGLDTAMAEVAESGNYEKVGAQFATIAEEAKKSAEANGETALTTRQLLDLMPQYEAALLAAASAVGADVTETELLNWAMGKVPTSMTAAAAGMDIMTASVEETGVGLGAVIEDMEKFLELLFALGLATMSSRDANVAYHEAIRGIDEAMKTVNESGGTMGAMLNENATDFNLATEAGGVANAAFQELARSGMTEVETMSNEGLGQDALQGKLTETYNDLVTAANGMGITGTAAEDLARKVLGVPDGVDIKTWMDDIASGKTDALEQKLNNLDGKLIETFTNNYVNTHYKSIISEERIANAPGGSGGLQRSSGGAIYGPGTGTSDDVPIMGSDGEHMFTAAEVNLMGGQQAVYQFRSSLRQNNGLAGHTAPEAAPVMVSSRQLVSAGGGGGTLIQYNIDQSFEATNARAEGIIRELGEESANKLNRTIKRLNVGRGV